MIRLEPEDFEDARQRARLADAAKLSLEEFERTFGSIREMSATAAVH
jgi:hypothetical protein